MKVKTCNKCGYTRQLRREIVGLTRRNLLPKYKFIDDGCPYKAHHEKNNFVPFNSIKFQAKREANALTK